MLFRINALMVTLVLLLACFVLHVSGGEALPPPTYCPAACAKSPLSSIRRDACCLGYSRGDVARKQYDYVSRDEVDDFALAREGPGRTVDMPHDAASTLLSSSTRRRRGGRCSSSSSSSSSRTSSSSRIAAAVYTSSRKSTQGAPWNRQFTIHHHDGCITLNYYGIMLAGAIARATAATAVHPLNVIKTIFQLGLAMPDLRWSTLSRGAGSQFIMSVPHGALAFAVTETAKARLVAMTSRSNSTLTRVLSPRLLHPSLDLASSALSTLLCTVVSTPQMVLTDRIMAGSYANFPAAVVAIASTEGVAGFYRGWLPALLQKIPSYALTWMLFQQIKAAFFAGFGRAGTALENTLLGGFAAAGACCVMIPVDTIKTRIVMGGGPDLRGLGRTYGGIVDCFRTVYREEGLRAFYRALPPRLCCVVPMIGIQFSVYELMKRILLQQPPPKRQA